MAKGPRIDRDPRAILTGGGYYRRMGRIAVHALLIAGAAIVLAGCGIADSRAPVPEFMRGKASEPPPPEPPPDVKRLLRENLDSVFVAASYPRQVRVAPPHRDVRGSGWTACVRADLYFRHRQAAGDGDLPHHDQRRHDHRPPARRGRRHLRIRKLR